MKLINKLIYENDFDQDDDTVNAIIDGILCKSKDYISKNGSGPYIKEDESLDTYGLLTKSKIDSLTVHGNTIVSDSHLFEVMNKAHQYLFGKGLYTKYYSDRLFNIHYRICLRDVLNEVEKFLNCRISIIFLPSEGPTTSDCWIINKIK